MYMDDADDQILQDIAVLDDLITIHRFLPDRENLLELFIQKYESVIG